MTYITSVCVFVSGWYTCCILLDRFMFIHTCPNTAKYLSTKLKAKFMCGIILIFGVVVYLNISLLYRVYDFDYKSVCLCKEEYRTIIAYFTKVELSLFQGLPYLCIILLLLLMFVLWIINHLPSEIHQVRGVSSNCRNTMNERQQYTNGKTTVSHEVDDNSRPNFLSLSIAIGVFFIIFTVPGYAMVIILTVYMEPQNVAKMTLLILLINQLLQILFYFRFALNGFLYLICDHTFRKSTQKLFKSTFQCGSSAKQNNEDNGNCISLEEQQVLTTAEFQKNSIVETKLILEHK